MSLRQFHPLVATWFERRFNGPTEVQTEGWAAIAAGSHTLLCAPTGSGKTLAAFLVCIDALVRRAAVGELDDRTEVVYVSPLKALSNDVRKNLEEPLAEIAALARDAGTPLAEIRIATRTGDTPARERQLTAKRPPHIWITTPESLFILLTSDSGRRGLAGTRTLIVDEIHAIAADKRGAHLALSIERLEQLAGRALTRIGLSATVSPLDEIARLLVGTRNVDDALQPACTIVDIERKRHLDLAIEVPAEHELGPIATHDQWAETLQQIAGMIGEHRTTLVFVNTRRLVERVALRLSELLGEEAVVAHHGSLSKTIRLRAEERLKNAEVRVCVATASLELGIDVGAVELACQIGSPRSVAVFLQRVGRSGHAIDRTPKGRLFPLTRDDLIECTALLRLARRGELDALTIPPWPLDVLAQQLVAACASDEWEEDDLFALARGAWPYRDIPRERFDQVIEMLSRGFDTSRGRRSAMLLRDSVNRRVKGRRGARIAAITSGGAIPDNADYDVVQEPDGTRVGRINEDFAIESMAGDVFLLGNAAWRIRRVERGTVRVEDAHGASPTIPFWLGEAPARSRELSHAVGELREAIDRLLDEPGAAVAWLATELGLGPAAAAQAVAYIAEGKRVLGVVPTARRIVAERFFDESGGMQLLIHAPFGGRINRAWGLALRKRFCRSFNFELQAAATDDGVNLSLSPQHSFPLADVFQFLTARTVVDVLQQAVLPSPIFATRWRWTAGRALALLRFQGGRKVPPALQRMRAEDLLAAVFPAQVQCQDEAPPGDIEIPDHPLVMETMRDCLREALDVDGLIGVLRSIQSGELEVCARDTPQPSAFGHELLNAMPYAFLDDAPLEERRARAVSLRRALPDDGQDLGRLDPDAIQAAHEDAWPVARDADELHDALLTLVLARPSEWNGRTGGEHTASWLRRLERDGRVCPIGDQVAPTELAEVAGRALAGDPAAVLAVVRGRSSACGPFRVAELAATLGIPAPLIDTATAALEAEGILLRGAFRAPDAAEWCDRRILARIHRATIRRLRREIEPVTTAVFLRFLAGWQHVLPATRLDVETGLLDVLESLQGFEAAVAAWETAILPTRVKRYDPEVLDRLCLNGAVVWGRFSHRHTPDLAQRRGPLSRVAPVTVALRRDLGWLLAPLAAATELSSRAVAVRDLLRARGATFADDIAAAAHLLPTELQETLSELVAHGVATADGFTPLRRLARGASDRRRRASSRFQRRSVQPLESEGRWWLLERPATASPDALEAAAAQLLRRYGLVFRDILAREAAAPAWRELLPVLRRAEARGEIRGGRFIAGFVGEQFALPEAVDELRAVRRIEPEGSLMVVSACDPLNLAGILTPGPRVTAIPDNRVILRDGVPVAWCAEDAQPHSLGAGDPDAIIDEARGALRLASVGDPARGRAGN